MQAAESLMGSITEEQRAMHAFLVDHRDDPQVQTLLHAVGFWQQNGMLLLTRTFSRSCAYSRAYAGPAHFCQCTRACQHSMLSPCLSTLWWRTGLDPPAAGAPASAGISPASWHALPKMHALQSEAVYMI